MMIYETPEWKDIAPLERAQLLLVMEGQRPASELRSFRGTLIDILQERGLEAQPMFNLTNPPKDRHLLLEDQWLVSLPEYLRNHNREIIAAKDMDSYHRALGTFLGYPNCCVEAYIHGERGLGVEPLHRSRQWSNYRIEFAEEIELGHDIPAGLNYKLFVPCSVSCGNAINTGRSGGRHC